MGAHYQKLMLLTEQLDENEQDEQLILQIRELMATAHRMLHDYKERFSNRPYPFDHADKDIMLGYFLVGDIPPSDYLNDLIHTMHNAISESFSLMGRIAANLSVFVVKVEKDLNIN